MLVLDNSIVMSWCFKDKANNYAGAVLEAMVKAEALVPQIWSLKVVNVLLVAERKKRLKPADSARFLELLSALPIQVAEEKTEDAMHDLITTARLTNLTSYDTSYLSLAMRHGLPLATLDKQLKQVAKIVNIEIFKS
jgi:predicted nucleic acid-binding protein